MLSVPEIRNKQENRRPVRGTNSIQDWAFTQGAGSAMLPVLSEEGEFKVVGVERQ